MCSVPSSTCWLATRKTAGASGGQRWLLPFPHGLLPLLTTQASGQPRWLLLEKLADQAPVGPGLGR